MKTIFTSLALLCALSTYSQYCDNFGDPVNPRMIPIPDSTANELALMAIAEIEACHCCNFPYTYLSSGTVSSGEFSFNSSTDSLYIHDITATGQDFSGIWGIIDNYIGSIVVFNYMVFPSIFGSFEIEHNTGVDHGTYWAYHVTVLAAPTPAFASKRAHCFVFSLGGTRSNDIPLAGTNMGSPVTGAIYFDGAATTYLAPQPNGIDLTCQNGLDFSRYSIGENFHRFRANDGVSQLELTLTDSTYFLGSTNPFFECQTITNKSLLQTTHDLIQESSISGRKHTYSHTNGLSDMRMANILNPPVMSQYLLYWDGVDHCNLIRSQNATGESQTRQTPYSHITTVTDFTLNTILSTGVGGHSETVTGATMGATEVLVPGVASIGASDFMTSETANITVSPNQVGINLTGANNLGAVYGSPPVNVMPMTLVWKQWVEDYVTAWQGSGPPVTPGDYVGRRYHDNLTVPYGVYEYTGTGGWVLLN